MSSRRCLSWETSNRASSNSILQSFSSTRCVLRRAQSTSSWCDGGSLPCAISRVASHTAALCASSRAAACCSNSMRARASSMTRCASSALLWRRPCAVLSCRWLCPISASNSRRCCSAIRRPAALRAQDCQTDAFKFSGPCFAPSIVASFLRKAPNLWLAISLTDATRPTRESRSSSKARRALRSTANSSSIRKMQVSARSRFSRSLANRARPASHSRSNASP
mmetsp:Transcript_746/g.1603  ORF Transcript_746/g.1603 Transcript_746/m.1603 type:complete len:223 (+) Transcript_746:2628-3296(+)